MSYKKIYSKEIGQVHMSGDFMFSRTGDATTPDFVLELPTFVDNCSYYRHMVFTLPTTPLVFSSLYPDSTGSWIKFLYLKNLDATNFLEVRWTDAKTGLAGQETVIYPGKVLMLHKIWTITARADTGAIELEMLIAGTGWIEPGTDATYAIP